MRKRNKGRSLIFTVSALLFFSQVCAQSLPTPRTVSPACEIKQTIGLTDITINYSRPRVTLDGNDRTGKIWGDLVEYGYNKIGFGYQSEIPWRAGANENTLISFEHDVKIQGKSIKAGTYGLFMAIFEDGSVDVIFSNATTAWGSFWYRPEDEVLKVKTEMKEHSHTEILTYDFIEFGEMHIVLALLWEKKIIPIKIEVDVHEIVLRGFRDGLKGVSGFGWEGPLSAAEYCLEKNINLDEGLGWSQWALNNGKNFRTLSTRGKLLIVNGKKDEGMKLLEESVDHSNQWQLSRLGYFMMDKKDFDTALGFFQTNAKRHPKDAVVYENLGNAYKAKGDKNAAIKNFKKALSLNPDKWVKANVEKQLKELGA